MSEQKNKIDWPQFYTDKANEIKKILNGLSQQDIQNIMSIFEGMLPVTYFLVAPQE